MSLIKFQTPASLFDRYFNDAFQNISRELNFRPQVDVAETEKSFELSFSLPGLKKEEIKINLEGNVLTVSGERKLNKEQKNKNFHSVETQYGSFSRSFELPETVEINKIDASYKDGLLSIELPKTSKTIAKAEIEIK
jgi:HSP20 family protein